MNFRPAISIVLLAAIVLFTADSSIAGKADDEKAVAELDTQYQLAVKNNDAATMARILADGWGRVPARGATANKADLLKDATSRAVIYEHQEDTQQRVRVWGDTAVVTA